MVLTLEEARPIACEVMRVLSARYSQCSNRIQVSGAPPLITSEMFSKQKAGAPAMNDSKQIGTVSEEGVTITEPFYLDDKWDHEGYATITQTCPPLRAPVEL